VVIVAQPLAPRRRGEHQVVGLGGEVVEGAQQTEGEQRFGEQRYTPRSSGLRGRRAV
jgi:hypothetical protein